MTIHTPVVDPSPPAVAPTQSATAFTLWHRSRYRAKWRIVAQAATERAADDQIGSGGRRHGQWLTLPAGQDANAKRTA